MFAQIQKINKLMKYLMTMVICFLSIAAFAQIDEEKAFLLDIAEAEGRSHEDVIGFRANPLTDNYDVKYHRMNWTVDPAQHYIAGSVTTYFEPTDPDFSTIYFDLRSNMTVNDVLYNGESLNYNLQSNHMLKIDFPSTLSYGVLDSVTIEYEGAPDGGGFGSFATGYHAGTPMLWTLSEPYGARDWWPCKQDLVDKIDSVDIHVTTPSEYVVASNGLRQTDIVSGNNTTYHWKHRYKIPAYLVAIAVTNYEQYDQHIPHADGEILVENYLFPEDVSGDQISLNSLPAIMDLFNEKFGLYPFADEKYGHASFGWGGGMEHTTMSFMGSYSFGLMAHELAHQWFGDQITCGSWEDIWLNEGFASYLTGMCYENELGPTTWDDWKQGRIDFITSQPGGSVFVDDTTSVSRIFSSRLTYNKGGMLLHMLRWNMGDDDFFQSIKNYLQDPDLAYGYAVTDDLIEHMEAQSGMELDEFFADWYYGQGYPIYDVEWSQDENNMLSVTVNQSQSHSSVGFFEMPLPIRVKGNGQEEFLRFDHTVDGETFTKQLDFAVEDFEFNADLWIVCNVNSVVLDTEQNTLPANAVTITPNPATDVMNIITNDPAIVLEQVNIYGASGKLIKTATTTQVDISLLPKGNYAVEIIANGKKGIKKLIKQ